MSTNKDKVWVTDFVANAILRFDPASEKFETFPSNKRGAAVRQMLGRAGRSVGRGVRHRPAGGGALLRLTLHMKYSYFI